MSTDRPISRRAALTGVVGLSLASASGCTGRPRADVAPTASTTPAAPQVPSGPTSTSASAAVTPSRPGPARRQGRTHASTDLLRTAGPDLTRGPRAVPVVALTFHGAGPSALTEDVLALLERAGAQVTVFAVGTWLQAHLDLGRAITKAGHDLGNHTWSHQTMTRLDAAQARREVTRGARAVAAVLGHPGPLFRPSGTPRSTPTIRAAALASGYRRCISYDVDPGDYLDPGADAVCARTLAQVGPGSIVSLHLGHRGTAEALPKILRGLTRRGLRPVTLTRMFAS